MSLIAGTVKRLVGTTVSEFKDKPAYKLYYLSTPHCENAVSFKDIYGKTVWKCRHEL